MNNIGTNIASIFPVISGLNQNPSSLMGKIKVRSYLFLVVFIALAVYTMAMPLAWAPPICSGIFNIETQTCIPISASAIPEPSTMALVAIGLGGAAFLRRKKK